MDTESSGSHRATRVCGRKQGEVEERFSGASTLQGRGDEKRCSVQKLDADPKTGQAALSRIWPM